MAALTGATMVYAVENDTVEHPEERNERFRKETEKIRIGGWGLHCKVNDLTLARKFMIRDDIPALTKKAEEVEKQVKDIANKVKAAEGKGKAAEDRAKAMEARLADAAKREEEKSYLRSLLDDEHGSTSSGEGYSRLIQKNIILRRSLRISM